MSHGTDTSRLPRVSACLMTYNGTATVERALSSLLHQTMQDCEIVISDDQSVDDTLAICERVAAGDPRVRFIRPPHNLGAQRNMEFALSHARGKYFVWCCQDDYWEPEFLERLSAALDAAPTAVAAQSQVHRISYAADRETYVRLQGRDLPERQSRLELASSIITHRSREHDDKVKNSIFMHGVLMRETLLEVLKAHRKLFSNERQILCHLALAGEFRYIDDPLFHKVFYGYGWHKRAEEGDATAAAKSQTDRWVELKDTLAGIIRSPVVDLRTKITAVPALMSSYGRHRLRIRDVLLTRLIRVTKRIAPARFHSGLKAFYFKASGSRKQRSSKKLRRMLSR